MIPYMGGFSHVMKAATTELLDLTIDVENDWNLFVFNYSQIVYYSVEDSAVLEYS